MIIILIILQDWRKASGISKELFREHATRYLKNGYSPSVNEAARSILYSFGGSNLKPDITTT